MSVFWLTFILTVATIDRIPSSRAENFIIFAVFWTMYRADIAIEISMLFYTKVRVLASFFINSSWAIDVVWWANGWAVRGIWAIFSLIIGCSVFARLCLFAPKRSFFGGTQDFFGWTSVRATMGIRLSRTKDSINIFSLGVANILTLATLVNITVVINCSVTFDFPVLAFNWTSSWAHTVWSEIIRLFWYANIVFFAAIMSDVTFTKVLGIITDKLALLQVTEFSRVINLLSLTVIWVRTAIIWIIRLFAWNFIIFA